MGKPPARWRHGGLLLCPSADGHPSGLRFPQETKQKAKFLGSPTKRQPLALASRPHSPFCAPRETGAEKEKKQMIEQIKQTNRGQFNVEGSVQVRTGNAPTGAERKPMVSWAALLDEAVKKPGFIHEAYSRFHNYSLGNQLLALFQCIMRGIQPGPLATFPKWKELRRFVKKGQKALTLCMPLTCTRTKTVKKDDGTDQEEEFFFTHFTYKAHCCSCADRWRRIPAARHPGMERRKSPCRAGHPACTVRGPGRQHAGIRQAWPEDRGQPDCGPPGKNVLP